MPHEVIMPKLGLTMTYGRISRWLKKEGDKVAAGEALVEIETDKINSEVEAPADGYLLKILAGEGEEREITAPICIIGEKDEAGKTEGRIFITPVAKKLAVENKLDYTKISPTGPEGRMVLKDVRKAIEEARKPSIAEESNASPQIKISPLARKMAEENGIDYRQVKGSGPEGRVVKEDIAAAIESAKSAKAIEEAGLEQPAAITPAPSGGKRIPLAGVRKVIAQRLSQSKHDIPHVYFKTTVDMGKITELKDRVADAVKARSGKKPSLNDMIIRAVAVALESFGDINVSLIDNEIVYHGDINIGMAVNSDRGLIVPVIRNANLKSLSEICKNTGVLAEKAKAGKLTPEEISGGTFTVSNLGPYQMDEFSAIINPPESAILAVGTAKDVPYAENGQLVIKTVAALTLSVDHRVIDGALAAQFMKKLKDLLEDPYTLLI